MSDNVQSIGYLSHSGDFSLRNNRVLGDVTQLWSDAFARAMAEQSGDDKAVATTAFPEILDQSTGEPIAGAQTLSKIVEQRACPVTDTQVRPPEPLFLPIAEFELDLLPPAAEPFSAMELIEQQRNLEFDTEWVRPTVFHAYDDSGKSPSAAPRPRPLHLPIAELEWDLAEKPAEPYDQATLVSQQRALDFDNGWARPLILQNLRQVA
ncbi:energy transducer TonB [Pseudomonas sp. LJDD11]|uniref:energy transducer TonB n=1 Tax=Pseudomonas sp. LJDD11 TaxID=2931984 RepID=UPI00211C7D8E|nr:energy transducer TonB [Pseudomonas sp. LJDD11]MCQ9422636.1 energy transducer TonB [Pseudomonas sp. LJDD11]